jgi:hypothetical protein
MDGGESRQLALGVFDSVTVAVTAPVADQP